MLLKKSRLAELGLLLTAIIWGSAFVVVKNTTDAVPTNYILATRFLLAAVLLAAIFWKSLKKLNKSYVKSGAILGVLVYLSFYLQTVGIQYTTAGNNAFLTAIYVVVVPFLYWLVRKKKPGVYNVLAAFLCMIGIGFLSLQDNLTVNIGDALTLLCGILFAAQIVGVSIFTEKQDPILLTLLQFLVAGVIALIAAFIFEDFPQSLGTGPIVGLLYLSIFSTTVAFLMQTVGQKYTSASKASLLMCLESVFGCVSGILFLHEPVTPKILAGFVLIFIAVLISELKIPSIKGIKKLEPVPIEKNNEIQP